MGEHFGHIQSPLQSVQTGVPADDTGQNGKL